MLHIPKRTTAPLLLLFHLNKLQCTEDTTGYLKWCISKFNGNANSHLSTELLQSPNTSVWFQKSHKIKYVHGHNLCIINHVLLLRALQPLPFHFSLEGRHVDQLLLLLLSYIIVANHQLTSSFFYISLSPPTWFIRSGAAAAARSNPSDESLRAVLHLFSSQVNKVE